MKNYSQSQNAKHVYVDQKVVDFLITNGLEDFTRKVDPEQIRKNAGYFAGDTKQYFRYPGTRGHYFKLDYINIHVFPDDTSFKGAFNLDQLRAVVAFMKLDSNTKRELSEKSILGLANLPKIIQDMKDNEYSVYNKARYRKLMAAWDSVKGLDLFA